MGGKRQGLGFHFSGPQSMKKEIDALRGEQKLN